MDILEESAGNQFQQTQPSEPVQSLEKRMRKGLMIAVVPGIISALLALVTPVFPYAIFPAAYLDIPVFASEQLFGLRLVQCEGSFICFPTIIGSGFVLITLYFLLVGVISSIVLHVCFKKHKGLVSAIIAFVIIASPLYVYSIVLTRLVRSPASATVCALLMDGPDASPRSRCFSTVAVKTKNMALCTKASEPYAVWSCYTAFAEIKQDPSVCSALDGTPEQVCRGNTIKSIGLATARSCSTLSDDDVRDSCLEKAYSDGDKAQKESTDICNMMTGVSAQGGCLLSVAANSNNQSLCTIFDDTKYAGIPYLSKDNCYSQVGVHNNDMQICYKISTPSTKSYCIGRITYLNSHPTVSAVENPEMYGDKLKRDVFQPSKFNSIFRPSIELAYGSANLSAQMKEGDYSFRGLLRQVEIYKKEGDPYSPTLDLYARIYISKNDVTIEGNPQKTSLEKEFEAAEGFGYKPVYKDLANGRWIQSRKYYNGTSQLNYTKIDGDYLVEAQFYFAGNIINTSNISSAEDIIATLKINEVKDPVF